MSRRNNVNPDHYKVAGRLRPDDLASAQFSRAIAAKTTSQQQPDRIGKGLYFERAEPALEPPTPAAATKRPPKKKASSRPGATKRTGARKATKTTVRRRTAAPAKAALTRRKGRASSPKRPGKKR